jgi:hypothetical protein
VQRRTAQMVPGPATRRDDPGPSASSGPGPQPFGAETVARGWAGAAMPYAEVASQ